MARLHIIALATLLAFSVPYSAMAEKDQGPNSSPTPGSKPGSSNSMGMQRVNPAAMQNPGAIKNADINGPAKIMQCQKDCEGKFPKVDVAAAEKALNYAMREEKPNKTKIEKLKMDVERSKTRAAERDRNVKQCQSQCSPK